MSARTVSSGSAPVSRYCSSAASSHRAICSGSGSVKSTHAPLRCARRSAMSAARSAPGRSIFVTNTNTGTR